MSEIPTQDQVQTGIGADSIMDTSISSPTQAQFAATEPTADKLATPPTATSSEATEVENAMPIAIQENKLSEKRSSEHMSSDVFVNDSNKKMKSNSGGGEMPPAAIENSTYFVHSSSSAPPQNGNSDTVHKLESLETKEIDPPKDESVESERKQTWTRNCLRRTIQSAAKMKTWWSKPFRQKTSQWMAQIMKIQSNFKIDLQKMCL